ncbi:MAG: hypothetical protein P8J68_10145 [Arenicellaceae bacterium]|nr:hypothetical protein [Arenicellaceae bacterium]
MTMAIPSHGIAILSMRRLQFDMGGRKTYSSLDSASSSTPIPQQQTKTNATTSPAFWRMARVLRESSVSQKKPSPMAPTRQARRACPKAVTRVSVAPGDRS